MNLTSAAIEAAAKAAYEHQYSSLEGLWEFANRAVQTDFREQAKVALEAASLHMCPDIYPQRTEWPDIPRGRA